MKFKGFLFIATAAMALTLVGCGDKAATGGFANVNGAPITNAELLEYLEAKQTVRASIQGQPVNVQVQDTLAFQAMQDLVVRKLVLQMAKKEGVAPTPDDVENHIKLLGDVSPGYVKNLQARGLSMKGIKDQVEVDLAQQNLISKGITITDEEVDKYIKDNKAEFEDPAKADMYWIVANNQSRPEVDKALTEGTKFTDAAVKLSLDPEAKTTGGKFGARQFPTGVPLTQLGPDFRAAVEKTAPGKVTEWVPIPNQQGMFAKFSIIRKTEARPQEITESRKKLVKRGLAVARGQQTKDINEKLQSMLKEAKIDVTDPALKDLWKKFEENLKKSDVTAPGSASPVQGQQNKATGQ
ncbi:hypothetical protein C0431_04330 [bacterium]|jgi:hypothetical protein|nr:hypothetical protein [bacterium]